MKVTIELTANQVTAVQLLKLLEIYPAEELCGNAVEFYLRKLYQEKFGRKAASALLPTFYETAEDKVAGENRGEDRDRLGG